MNPTETPEIRPAICCRTCKFFRKPDRRTDSQGKTYGDCHFTEPVRKTRIYGVCDAHVAADTRVLMADQLLCDHAPGPEVLVTKSKKQQGLVKYLVLYMNTRCSKCNKILFKREIKVYEYKTVRGKLTERYNEVYSRITHRWHKTSFNPGKPIPVWVEGK